MFQGFTELLGPVFLHELRATKKSRVSLVLSCVLLQLTYAIVFNSLYERCLYEHFDRHEHSDLFTFWYDLCIALIRWSGVVALIPAITAAAFAGDIQRGTMELLSMGSVSMFEVVFKKLSARVVPVLVFLGLGAVVLGYLARERYGIDPFVTIAAYFGAITNVFFMASLTTLVAVGSRNAAEAEVRTRVIAVAWFLVPLLTIEIDRDFHYDLTNYLFWCDVNRLINPLFVDDWENINNISNIDIFTRFIRRACYTNLLQLIYGMIFVYLAARRLSPSPRPLDDSSNRASIFSWIHALRLRFSRIGAIRSCLSFIHPVVWKDLFFRRKNGTGRVLIASILKSASIGFIIYLIYHMIYDERYYYESNITNTLIYSDVDYFFFLRGSTSSLIFLSIVAATVSAAGSFTSERENDTWSCLASTPLGKSEVLLGKMAASALGSRRFFVMIAISWLLGHYLAAISRAGAVLVLVECVVFHWFFIALGTLVSLFSKSSFQSIGVASALLVFFNVAYLIAFIPFMDQSIPDASYFSGVTPLIVFQSFFPPDYLKAVDYIDKNWNRETMILYGLIFYGSAAAILTAACFSRYDRYCDRPRRSGKTRPRTRDLHREI